MYLVSVSSLGSVLQALSYHHKQINCATLLVRGGEHSRRLQGDCNHGDGSASRRRHGDGSASRRRHGDGSASRRRHGDGSASHNLLGMPGARPSPQRRRRRRPRGAEFVPRPSLRTPRPSLRAPAGAALFERRRRRRPRPRPGGQRTQPTRLACEQVKGATLLASVRGGERPLATGRHAGVTLYGYMAITI